MSHLTDIALRCAVTCAKSDNMRATASKIVCDAVEYLKTDAGVMEAHEAGVDPTMKGFFTLVTTAELVSVVMDPETGAEIETRTLALPKAFGGSFRTFQRLLQIGGNPDKDAELRQEQADADKVRRTASSVDPTNELLQTPPDAGANCNSAVRGYSAALNPTLLTPLVSECFDKLIGATENEHWPEWLAANREMVGTFTRKFLTAIPDKRAASRIAKAAAIEEVDLPTDPPENQLHHSFCATPPRLSAEDLAYMVIGDMQYTRAKSMAEHVEGTLRYFDWIDRGESAPKAHAEGVYVRSSPKVRAGVKELLSDPSWVEAAVETLTRNVARVKAAWEEARAKANEEPMTVEEAEELPDVDEEFERAAAEMAEANKTTEEEEATAEIAEAAEEPEQVEEDPDAVILKKLSRTPWVGPDKRDTLGISDEDVERLIIAGKLHRHPKSPANVGVVS